MRLNISDWPTKSGHQCSMITLEHNVTSGQNWDEQSTYKVPRQALKNQ